MEQRNQRLEKQLDANHQVSKKMETQLTERIGELEAELFNESREDSLGELEEECRKLHEVIDALRAENDELETRIGATNNNDELEQQLAAAKTHLTELELSSRQEVDAAKSTQQSDQAALAQLKSELDAALAQVVAVSDESSSRIVELEKSLIEQKAENLELLDQLKSHHESTPLPVSAPAQSLDQAEPNKRIAELEKLLAEQAADLAATRDEMRSNGDLEKAESQNKKLKQLALKTKKESDALKKKMEKVEEERKKTETKLKEINSKASNATSSFQAEYDRLQDELEQSQSDMKTLSDTNDTLKSTVCELSNVKEEKEMAKSELGFITEKLSTISSRLDNAMAREVQLESEVVQEKRARLDERSLGIGILSKSRLKEFHFNGTFFS